MALTVQTVVNQASFDIRQVLGTAGNDLTIFTNWVDRVHKDCLHSSVYSYLNTSGQNVITTSGFSQYPLTGSIRRILGVYDRVKGRLLFPIEKASAPVTMVEKQEINPGQQSQFQLPQAQPLQLQLGQPVFYRHLTSSNFLTLFPTPLQTTTLEVAAENQVVTLVSPSDTLVIPEDGVDMVVAGVNFYSSMFLKRAEEAQVWMQLYTALKKGESLA